MSVEIEIDARAALAALGRLAAADLQPLMEGIAAEVEGATRRRIETGKRDPAGTPWAPWSEDYARTRHTGHSLLRAQGHLLESIVGRVVGDDTVTVGSNLRYAAIHQFGGLPGMAPGAAAIPPRPYLGLSDAERGDIAAMAADYFAGLAAGRARV